MSGVGEDDLRPLHEVVLAVRWGDLDALGHLNNTVYFRFMEQARIEWLAAAGHPLTGSGEGIVIADAECTFLRAITYPAEVRVQMLGGPPGRSSFETRYLLSDAADPATRYATGRARVVWVDHAAERSRPLPQALRAALAGDVAP